MNGPYVVDEISTSESWRLFRIMAEFVEGVEALSRIQPGAHPAWNRAVSNDL